jgi:ABC-type amino acid transport substrate-binding protein
MDEIIDLINIPREQAVKKVMELFGYDIELATRFVAEIRGEFREDDVIEIDAEGNRRIL